MFRVLHWFCVLCILSPLVSSANTGKNKCKGGGVNLLGDIAEGNLLTLGVHPLSSVVMSLQAHSHAQSFQLHQTGLLSSITIAISSPTQGVGDKLHLSLFEGSLVDHGKLIRTVEAEGLEERFDTSYGDSLTRPRLVTFDLNHLAFEASSSKPATFTFSITSPSSHPFLLWTSSTPYDGGHRHAMRNDAVVALPYNYILQTDDFAFNVDVLQTNCI